MASENRIKYFDSLKGIACMFIFIGHFYYGFYIFASQVANLNSWIIYEHDLLNFLYNGTFCVAMFCFMEGFFTKECRSFIEVVHNTLKRYLRLALPIFILGIIFFLAQQLHLFNAKNEISNLIGSAWIKSIGKESTSIAKVFLNSFLGVPLMGRGLFSSQLWMIRYLLIGQMAFYVFYFCTYKNSIFTRVIALLICVFCLVWEYPCLVAFLGALFRKYEDRFNALKIPQSLIIIGGGGWR